VETYWIVNLISRQFFAVHSPDWDGDWPKRYFPKAGDCDVAAFHVGEFTGNGIPYVCDFCHDGGLYTLLVDRDKHNDTDIEQAKAWLRHRNDVVTLHTYKLIRTGVVT